MTATAPACLAASLKPGTSTSRMRRSWVRIESHSRSRSRKRSLAPSVGRLADDPSVWYGFGYHANGVNTAPWVGMRLATAIAGSNREDTDFPAVMAGLAPRFPFAAMRLWCLRAAYVYYRFQDAR